MKKHLFLPIYLFLCGSTFALLGQDKILVIEGTYMGKNLYVQNTSTIGYCVTSVEVNGKETTDETNSSAFEIDFKPCQLKLGDKIEVRIHYKNDCLPNILNTEVIKPLSTFTVTEIKASPDGTIQWTSVGELGALVYQVEQLRWKKWVKVGEVMGLGTSQPHQYTFKTQPHSGINVYRVQQTDHTGKANASPAAECNSHLPQVVFKIDENGVIRFTVRNKNIATETLFEIYDQYGQLLKRGYGTAVDVSDLPKGVYYINYDNKAESFKR